jgi:tRNA pseudouridine38-40 synthase
LRSAIQGRFSWHIGRDLDAEAMRRGCHHLVGLYDFAAFAKNSCDTHSTVRKIECALVWRDGEHIYVELTANSFLRSMVRTIVGTLVECGSGVRDASEMAGVVESRDRRKAGPTAPPQGLTFVSVEY